MKKLIFIAVFLLFPTLTFASFDRNLSYGMNGTDVADLQDILNTEGCFTNTTTGYFGPITVQAVKCFQLKKDISSTGYVGVLTRTALNVILEDVVASSTEAQISEIGTSTPAFICPVGYTCNPNTQINNIIVPPPSPTIGNQITNIPTNSPTIVSTVSLTDQKCIGYTNREGTVMVKPVFSISFTGSDVDIVKVLFLQNGVHKYGSEQIPTANLYPEAGTYQFSLTSFKYVSEPYLNDIRMVKKEIASKSGEITVRDCGDRAETIVPYQGGVSA